MGDLSICAVGVIQPNSRIKNWHIFGPVIPSPDCYNVYDRCLAMCNSASLGLLLLTKVQACFKAGDMPHLATVKGTLCVFLLCSRRNLTSVHISI